MIGDFLGQYRIIELLGRGGMATVYKAYQAKLNRYVAVKILPARLVQGSDFLPRFEREARATANLRHRNILIVHDYGEQEGNIYLVMEYVEGGTLRDLITGQPMPWPTAVNIIIQISDALAYAHRQGIIHRDVKPSNILMKDLNWPLLSDFGLAKVMKDSPTLTRHGIAIGTPEYMSPEQAQAEPIDGRTDIYALGVVLYEMVTGQKPFEAEAATAVLLKHIRDPVPAPRTIVPDLPQALEHVILRAMAKNPNDRFQTMQEMTTALRQTLAGGVVQPQRAWPSPSAPPSSPPPSPPPPQVVSQPRVRAEKTGQQWLIIVGGLAAIFLCLVALGSVFLVRRGQLEATPTPTFTRTLALSPTAVSAIPTDTPTPTNTIPPTSAPPNTPTATNTAMAGIFATDTPTPAVPCFDTRFQHFEPVKAGPEVLGRVYDLQGQALPGVTVEIYEKGRRLESDQVMVTLKDGDFHFTNLDVGRDYIVRAINAPGPTGQALHTWDEPYTFRFAAGHQRAIVDIYQIPYSDQCHYPIEAEQY